MSATSADAVIEKLFAIPSTDKRYAEAQKIGNALDVAWSEVQMGKKEKSSLALSLKQQGTALLSSASGGKSKKRSKSKHKRSKSRSKSRSRGRSHKK